MKLLKLKFNKKIVFLIIVFILLGFLLFLLSRSYRTVVLLQNTDEVRATGGFLGSIALIEHRLWQIKSLQFYDIYDLDHQITSFPSAPAGMKKYLSAGKDELHLVNANWERDFPTSAKQISQLIVASGQSQPDIIISLNSSLIGKILDFLQSLGRPITWQNEVLNSSNFSLLARVDHQLLALNRQPKTRFLQQFYQSFKTTLKNLSIKEKISLIHLVWQQKNQRDWQIYATSFWWQTIFQLLGVTGSTKTSLFYQQIYFVPSNVGINKSNHGTEIILDLEPTQKKSSTATIKATIINHNALNEEALLIERLHFANYQRFLLPPAVTVQSLSVNQEQIETYDERFITDSRGHKWREIGFLLVVNEQSQSEIELILTGAEKKWRVSF